MVQTMLSSAPCVQWTITLEDVKMAKAIKRTLLAMKGVVSVQNTSQKALMSKEDYYAMIDNSIQQAEQGKTISMLPNESVEQFLDRIACIQ